MRRYNRKNTRDRRDLESRLEALESTPRRGRGRKPKRKRGGGGAGSAVFGLLVVATVLGVVYLIVSNAMGSGEVAEAEEHQVEVVQGDTLSSVADKLESQGVIGSSFFFTLQARMSGESADIKPGQYTFAEGEGREEILAKLTAGEAIPTFTVTIPEGLTLEQTAEVVGETGKVTEEEFLQAANKTDYGYAFLEDPAIKNTEGFLFPKSYEFEEGTDARGVVNRLLEQYLIETENVDYASASEELNLSEYELLTVASLIEREAANEEEKPRIASVIHNRIRAGMPLQIDATIQYARGEQKENLSLEDLEIDSPYNTYQNPGLPPGPIASPSLSSIRAALNPEDSNYIYYVLTPDGDEHFFTDDYNEFLQAKADAGL